MNGLKQGAVKLKNAIDNKPNAQSAKDDRAQDAWNKSQGCVGKECEENRVGGIGAIQVNQDDCQVPVPIM